MTRPYAPGYRIPTDLLLKAYASGVFPMAESASDPEVFWVRPETRGIIPLDAFHIPSRLARTVRNTHLTIACDRDFDAVIEACAAPGPKRARTWINDRIRALYRGLFDIGHCHTVEVYDGDALVGGLYGVSLGRAFFGESMFHVARDASKIALVHLVARLRAGGYRLLDTQYLTDHLKMFGTAEISRARYQRELAKAIRDAADPAAFAVAMSGTDAVSAAARDL